MKTIILCLILLFNFAGAENITSLSNKNLNTLELRNEKIKDEKIDVMVLYSSEIADLNYNVSFDYVLDLDENYCASPEEWELKYQNKRINALEAIKAYNMIQSIKKVYKLQQATKEVLFYKDLNPNKTSYIGNAVASTTLIYYTEHSEQLKKIYYTGDSIEFIYKVTAMPGYQDSVRKYVYKPVICKNKIILKEVEVITGFLQPKQPEKYIFD